MEGRLTRSTVWVTGPEELRLREGLERIAGVIGRRPLIFPAPVVFHRLLARLFELTMKVPLVSRAQVRMLAEGLVEPAGPCEGLPEDLRPRLAFTPERIRAGLPEPRRFGRQDLRCWRGEKARCPIEVR